MSATKTNISWTDSTWNPIIGCSKCSPGCAHCYAERMASRQGAMGTRGYANVVTDGHWNGKTVLIESELDKPMHWRKGRTIFPCSMSDLFHESVPVEDVAHVYNVMAHARQHKFMVLTKRVDRLLAFLLNCGDKERSGWITHDGTYPRHAYDGTGVLISGDDRWPLPNVANGATICNQDEADAKLPLLLRVPSAKRFVSIEPMLSAIVIPPDVLAQLDYVICGGETGPGARPIHPDWVRSLRDQCAAAGVPFHFKQWGEYCAGCQLHEFTTDLDVEKSMWLNSIGETGRPGPGDEGFDNCIRLWRVGKHRAGRLLDGVEHNGRINWEGAGE